MASSSSHNSSGGVASPTTTCTTTTSSSPNSTTSRSTYVLSQDYFDELCVENAQLFDLSLEDAVHETIEQLTTATTTTTTTTIAHLSWTVPTSPEGRAARQRRVQLQAAVRGMRRLDRDDDGDGATTTSSSLAVLQDQVRVLEDCLLLPWTPPTSTDPPPPTTTTSTSSSTSSTCATTVNSNSSNNNNNTTNDTTLFPHLWVAEQGIAILLIHGLGTCVAAAAAGEDEEASPTTIASTRRQLAVRILRLVNRYCGGGARPPLQPQQEQPPPSFGRVLQETMTTQFAQIVPTVWMPLYCSCWGTGQFSTAAAAAASELQLQLLQLAYHSMRQCEVNKQLWMKQATPTAASAAASGENTTTNTTTEEEMTLAALLVRTLQNCTRVLQSCPIPKGDEEENIRNGEAAGAELNNDHQPPHTATSITAAIAIQMCQIMTTLLTFDDFRDRHNDDDNAPPVVQSGPVHAQQLANQSAVPVLHEFLLQIMTTADNDNHKDSSERLLLRSAQAATITALRSLAIHNDIVQSMVVTPVGADEAVLDTAGRLLSRVVLREPPPALQSKTTCTSPTVPTKTNDDFTLALATALVGLLRNLSANDNVKTMLFRDRARRDSSTISVPHAVVQLMTRYPTAAQLQEHACGWVAAVALRQPHIAGTLVQNLHVHTHVVAAMQRHAASVPLQRQAALALRNLVSRASDEAKQQVLDEAPATEYALRQVAGRWLSCQDEVYAALRDLGLATTSVHVVVVDDDNHNPRTVVQHGRLTFGDGCNANFRPVLD